MRPRGWGAGLLNVGGLGGAGAGLLCPPIPAETLEQPLLPQIPQDPRVLLPGAGGTGNRGFSVFSAVIARERGILPARGSVGHTEQLSPERLGVLGSKQDRLY